MTAILYPREYASDTNFSSGVDSGSPSKVDPGSALEAQGRIAGAVTVAAHHNYSINRVSKVARWLVEQSLSNLLSLVPGDLQSAPDAVFDGPGAAVANATGTVFLIKGGSVYRDNNGSLELQTASAGSCTQPLAAAGPRVATGTLGVVGSIAAVSPTGGALTRSTDAGVTWRPQLMLIANDQQTVQLSPFSDLFLINGSTAGVIHTSTTLNAVNDRALSAAHIVRGVACAAARSLVLRDNGGAPAFDSSTDDVVFATTGATVSGATDSFGSICSNGSLFFWAGKKSATNAVSFQSSSIGAAWSEISTVTPPSGTTTAGFSTQLACHTASGIIWMAVQGSAGWWLYVTPDSGVTWIGPRNLGTTRPSLSVVGGYLYVGQSGRPFLRTPFRLS